MEKERVQIEDGSLDLIFAERLDSLSGSNDVIRSEKVQSYVNSKKYGVNNILNIELSDGRHFIGSQTHSDNVIKIYNLDMKLAFKCKLDDGSRPELNNLGELAFWKFNDCLLGMTTDEFVMISIKNNALEVIKRVSFLGWNFSSFIMLDSSSIGIGVTYGGVCSRFDLESGNFENIFQHTEHVGCMCQVKKEKNMVIIAGGEFKGYDFTISKVDIYTKEVVAKFMGATNSTVAMLTYINQQGVECLLTAGNLRDEVIRVWDIMTGKMLRQIKTVLAVWRFAERNGCILGAGIVRDYQEGHHSGIACLTENEMYLIDGDRESGVESLVWATDSLVVSGCQGGEIRFCKVKVKMKKIPDPDLTERIIWIVDNCNSKTIVLENNREGLKIPTLFFQFL